MAEDWIQVQDARQLCGHAKELVRLLGLLQTELQTSRADMQKLRGELQELRGELQELRAEVRARPPEVCKDCQDIRAAYSKVRRGEIFPFYKPLSRAEEPRALRAPQPPTHPPPP